MIVELGVHTPERRVSDSAADSSYGNDSYSEMRSFEVCGGGLLHAVSDLAVNVVPYFRLIQTATAAAAGVSGGMRPPPVFSEAIDWEIATLQQRGGTGSRTGGPADTVEGSGGGLADDAGQGYAVELDLARCGDDISDEE